MDGKAVLFKQSGGIDAIPLCLDTVDVDIVGAEVHADYEIPSPFDPRVAPARR